MLLAANIGGIHAAFTLCTRSHIATAMQTEIVYHKTNNLAYPVQVLISQCICSGNNSVETNETTPRGAFLLGSALFAIMPASFGGITLNEPRCEKTRLREF